MKHLIILICVMALLCLSGCAAFNGGNQAPDNTPIKDGQDALIKTVYETNWLVTISILGVAASFFAFLNGSKMGLAGMAACAVALFLSLGVVRYAEWMAWFGCIGSVLLVIATILMKNKTVHQLVMGVQQEIEQSYHDVEYPKIKKIMSGQLDKDSERVIKKEKKKLEKKLGRPLS